MSTRRALALSFALLLLVQAHAAVATAAREPDEDPQVVLRLDNQGERIEGEARLTRQRDDAVLHDQPFEAPARAVVDVATVIAAPDAYVVDLEVPRMRVSYHVDTRGCAGTFVVAFRVDDGFLGNVPDATGCLAVPPAAVMLREEAARVAAAPLPSPSERLAIEIPLPRDGDRGRYLAWYADAPTAWSDARTRFDFDARAAEVVDAAGAAYAGARFDYVRNTTSWCGIGVMTSAGTLGAEADTTGIVESAGFVGPEAKPVAETLASCSGEFSLGSLTGVQMRGSALAVTRHDTHTLASCLFRHALQGRALAEGERVPASDACAAWSPEGEWVAGRVARERGLDVIPLYLDAGGIVARATFAAGIPYPIEVEWWRVEDAPLRHRAYRLDGLDAGDAPLPLAPAAPRAHDTPRVVDIDPLLGPANDAPALRYALRDAAQEALANPTLGELRALVGREGAFLAAAQLRASAQQEGPGVVDTWYMLFAAPDAAPVEVACQRARDAPALPAGAACSERPPPSRVTLPPPPADASAADVPTQGAGFGEALARWARVAPDAARATPSYASYIAIGQPDEPARVGVGQDFPEGAPVDTAAEAEVDFVLLRLDDARTIVQIQGATGAASVARVPAALSSAAGLAAAAPAEAPAGGAPAAIVGAGAILAGAAAIALLAWLATKLGLVGFFTRLVRPRVLDHELRASIQELVQARPGAHAADIAQHFARAQNVVDHHLDVLVREGFLTCLQTPGFRRYFVTGRFSPAEMRAIAALQEGQTEKLYRIIESHPGIHVGELAEKAGVSVGYASKQVRRLAEAGLVDSVRVGRAVRLHALER